MTFANDIRYRQMSGTNKRTNQATNKSTHFSLLSIQYRMRILPFLLSLSLQIDAGPLRNTRYRNTLSIRILQHH